MNIWLADPLINYLNSFLRGKSPSGQPRISDNAEKRSDGLPRQPDGFGSRKNGLDRNTRHAAVVHRTSPQKAWAAGNSLANQTELLRHRSSALRICRTENTNYRDPRGRGHVHGS